MSAILIRVGWTTLAWFSEQLALAITREFISRTRYQVVAEPAQADAVLTGNVMNIFTFPTTFDSRTGRAAGVQLNVVLQIKLQDRITGQTLWEQPSFEARQRYEISIDQRAYFEESDAALDRLSIDVARAVVSAILEKF